MHPANRTHATVSAIRGAGWGLRPSIRNVTIRIVSPSSCREVLGASRPWLAVAPRSDAFMYYRDCAGLGLGCRIALPRESTPRQRHTLTVARDNVPGTRNEKGMHPEGVPHLLQKAVNRPFRVRVRVPDLSAGPTAGQAGRRSGIGSCPGGRGRPPSSGVWAAHTDDQNRPISCAHPGGRPSPAAGKPRRMTLTEPSHAAECKAAMNRRSPKADASAPLSADGYRRFDLTQPAAARSASRYRRRRRFSGSPPVGYSSAWSRPRTYPRPTTALPPSARP